MLCSFAVCTTMSSLSFLLLCWAVLVADFVAHWFIFVGIFCFIKIYILWYVHDVCTVHCVREIQTYTRIYCRIKSIKAGEILPSTAAERLHICHFFDVDERMKVVRGWDAIWCRDGNGGGVEWATAVPLVLVVVMERLCDARECGMEMVLLLELLFLRYFYLWYTCEQFR